MHARRTSSRWMAVMVRALTLAPWRGAALPRDMAVDPIPVEGVLSPDGRFVGTLTLETVTVTDAGRLRLTGALHGTATRRTGATTRLPHQTFSALAVPIDAEQTTDVVLVKMAPMALASGGTAAHARPHSPRHRGRP
jgi:hypothetical protein